jgi:hypothetical protein
LVNLAETVFKIHLSLPHFAKFRHKVKFGSFSWKIQLVFLLVIPKVLVKPGGISCRSLEVLWSNQAGGKDGLIQENFERLEGRLMCSFQDDW